jgi:hypothetical protein
VEGLSPKAQVRLYRGDEKSHLGWYSPRFGHKVPCTTLQIIAPTETGVNLVRWVFQSATAQTWGV